MRFVLLSIGLFWTLASHAEQMPVAVTEMLQKQNINPENISIWVAAVDNPQPLVALNADTARTPASVAKVLTTSAGLFALGANYRWHTEFWGDSLPDSNGIINGNLYVVGGGDPFLVNEQLTTMLSGLRHAGVRHITGDIVLDRSSFHLAPEEKTTFDDHPTAAYNAIPDALMVNFRTISINVRPQKGAHPALVLVPKIDSWTIDNQVQQVRKKRCQFYPSTSLTRQNNGYAVLHVKGTYSTSCGAQDFSIVAGEASEQFYYLFRDIWRKLGGSFDGQGRLGTLPLTAKKLFTGQSDPLALQIQRMNQNSNNVMTRQLFLTLGMERFGKPATLDKGRRAVLTTLAGLGLDTKGIIIDNGAGLSRLTRIDVRQLGQLLRLIYQSERASTFLDSLAVLGQKGTLKRLHPANLVGRVIGKTGTLDGVKAFAGFVRTSSNRNYIVVVIGNHTNHDKILRFELALFAWLYQQF